MAECDGIIIGVIFVDDDPLEDLHVAHRHQGRCVARLLPRRAEDIGARRLECGPSTHARSGSMSRRDGRGPSSGSPSSRTNMSRRSLSKTQAREAADVEVCKVRGL